MKRANTRNPRPEPGVTFLSPELGEAPYLYLVGKAEEYNVKTQAFKSQRLRFESWF